MGKKVYVGNLDYETSQSDLETMFSSHGTVESVQIISDRETGRSKGFGFIEMSNDAEAQAAIGALDGKDCGGRAILNISINVFGFLYRTVLPTFNA